MKKILIWKNKCWESKGSNLGDLAIIRSMINAIKNEMQNIEIILFSDDPDYTSNLYGVKSYRFNPKNIIKVINEIDFFLIGGGTVFTDISSIYTVFINTSLAYLALWNKKPIACYSIGVGKMTLFSRLLVKGLLNRFEFLSVRDHESKEELIKLNIKNPDKVIITEDAAFGLKNLIKQNDQSVKKKQIIISPRRIFHYKQSILPFYLRKKLGLLPKKYYQKMNELKQLLAEIADNLIDEKNVTIIFMPMYSAIGESTGISGYFKQNFSSRDDQVCIDIHNLMKNKEQSTIFYSDDPLKILGLLSESEMLIGIPLHSLILSYVAQAPFLGLSYQQKVSRFIKHVGFDKYMIHVEHSGCLLDKTEFMNKINDVLNDREKIIKIMEHTNQEFVKSVNTPAIWIKNVLEGYKFR